MAACCSQGLSHSEPTQIYQRDSTSYETTGISVKFMCSAYVLTSVSSADIFHFDTDHSNGRKGARKIHLRTNTPHLLKTHLLGQRVRRSRGEPHGGCTCRFPVASRVVPKLLPTGYSCHRKGQVPWVFIYLSDLWWSMILGRRKC